MPLTAELVGRSYPPSPPYAVGAAKIAEFAAAVGARSDLHTDPDAARAAGYADVVAPPTFAVIPAQACEAQLIADPEVGIDFSRVVHGEERFAHTRPIVAGDVLTGVLTIESVRVVGGNAMVTSRTELTTPEGEPVSTVTSMLVVRGE